VTKTLKQQEWERNAEEKKADKGTKWMNVRKRRGKV
jgi:hypothetical protein